MTFTDIAKHRLVNQQIVESSFTQAKALVHWMGALQAQDYAMAKWAIGLRLPQAIETDIEKSIDEGSIIRTHILRPTWHFVAADDIRWMLQLTAPQINAAAASRYRQLELDDALFTKSMLLIEKALADGKHLTRQELMTELQRAHIKTDEQRASHIMLRAELEGLVCNGSRRGKQFTYALLDTKVPVAPKLARAESIVKLALRYFTSHGPATLQDFSWWSGLTVTDAKSSMDALKAILQHETIDGKVYWFADAPVPQTKETIHFLPAFDEFLVSYKDRTAAIDPAFNSYAITINGIFKPIIVANGKVIGTWKRTFTKEAVQIDISMLNSEYISVQQKILSHIAPFCEFLNKPLFP